MFRDHPINGNHTLLTRSLFYRYYQITGRRM